MGRQVLAVRLPLRSVPFDGRGPDLLVFHRIQFSSRGRLRVCRSRKGPQLHFRFLAFDGRLREQGQGRELQALQRRVWADERPVQADQRVRHNDAEGQAGDRPRHSLRRDHIRNQVQEHILRLLRPRDRPRARRLVRQPELLAARHVGFGRSRDNGVLGKDRVGPRIGFDAARLGCQPDEELGGAGIREPACRQLQRLDPADFGPRFDQLERREDWLRRREHFEEDIRRADGLG